MPGPQKIDNKVWGHEKVVPHLIFLQGVFTIVLPNKFNFGVAALIGDKVL